MTEPGAVLEAVHTAIADLAGRPGGGPDRAGRGLCPGREPSGDG
jgi:hypothetical protein